MQEGYNYAAEEFYDASLKRSILVAELQHEGQSIDVSHSLCCPISLYFPFFQHLVP
jgi:hypothetical protein